MNEQLSTAILNKDQSSLIKLLRSGVSLIERNNEGQLAIHLAAQTGSIPICRIIVAYGSPLQISDYKGMKAIHYAKDMEFTELSTVIEDMMSEKIPCRGERNISDLLN